MRSTPRWGCFYTRKVYWFPCSEIDAFWGNNFSVWGVSWFDCFVLGMQHRRRLLSKIGCHHSRLIGWHHSRRIGCQHSRRKIWRQVGLGDDYLSHPWWKHPLLGWRNSYMFNFEHLQFWHALLFIFHDVVEGSWDLFLHETRWDLRVSTDFAFLERLHGSHLSGKQLLGFCLFINALI